MSYAKFLSELWKKSLCFLNPEKNLYYTQYGLQWSIGNASVELQYSKPLFFLKFSVLVTLNLTLIFEDNLLLFKFFCIFVVIQGFRLYSLKNLNSNEILATLDGTQKVIFSVLEHS